MKKLLLLLIGAGTALYSSAQTLPKPSPHSEVEQMVGATEIEIVYSRPGVKDRTIFGELVPFNQLWRFGANGATTITTEHTLFFENGELQPGTYSIFAIPEEDHWQIIFNTDATASTDQYTESKDVFRIDVEAVEHSFTENFTIGFDNIRDASASLVAFWENTKIEVPFTVDTKGNAIKNINAAIEKGENLGTVFYNAANFYYSSLKDNDAALAYVNKSIAIEKNYRNLFLQARIMYDLGKKDEAIKIGNAAMDDATKNASKGYQGFISSTLAKWAK